MKTTLIALGFALAFLVARAAGPSEVTLESQFRADMDAIIRSKSRRPPQQEALDKMVELAVTGMKRLHPTVLKEQEKKEVTPTDGALIHAHNDLERVSGGAYPEFVSFYTELWKSRRIQPRQRVLFERLMRAITEDVQGRKKQANQRLDRNARATSSSIPTPQSGAAHP